MRITPDDEDAHTNEKNDHFIDERLVHKQHGGCH